jgi:hypothetical protein
MALGGDSAMPTLTVSQLADPELAPVPLELDELDELDGLEAHALSVSAPTAAATA